MAKEQEAVRSGGCQCGAVRYAFYAEPISADICHCRMCQKALGNLFLAGAGVPLEALAWTRGEPAVFRSSSLAERGFCRECGTPLFFRYLGEDSMTITIGSLDEPARVRPREQTGIESRVPWLEEALGLPGKTTEEGLPGDVLARMEDFQHRERDA